MKRRSGSAEFIPLHSRHYKTPKPNWTSFFNFPIHVFHLQSPAPAMLNSLRCARFLLANEILLCGAVIFWSVATAFSGASSAEFAQKTRRPKDLNTPREFPNISSMVDWQARAEEIREQILVSCGLWPMPEKTPLHARVFGKIERGGYSVEKVYFQTFPGFYLAGNLYRPLGKASGPFPAILNPHGHWANGRMADTDELQSNES